MGPATASLSVTSPATYIDGQGRMWPVGLETGQVDTQSLLELDVGYSGPNCTGTAYLFGFSMVEPRIVFRLAGDAEGLLRVRPDDRATGPVTLASVRYSFGCQNRNLTERGFPADSTLPNPPLTVPSVSFTPPLRRSWE